MTQNLLPCENQSGSQVDAEAAFGALMGIGNGYAPLAAETFAQALFNLADELKLSQPTRLRILVAGRPKEVHSQIEEQICLIAREALLNALRHAEATRVEAEIEYLPRKFRVIVRDNGRGISPPSIANTQGGLVNMRERAGQIGGELRVWSRRGAGTEVEVCVPTHRA
jgi:signal transduction histidine kinase